MAAKGIETRVATGDADTYIVRSGLEKATSHPIVALRGQDFDLIVLLIALAPTERSTKNIRIAGYPDLEECLIKWFKQCRDCNLPIGGNELKEKAEQFAQKLGHKDFKSSNGWLENVKNRHNIIFRKLCCEIQSVSDELCSEWIKNLPGFLQKYSSDNIFSADETGLFFKTLPDKTALFQGETCHGGKQSKELVTLLLATNMSGNEKLTPLMIEKSRTPRCFKELSLFHFFIKQIKILVEE
ncbi:Tigger transposable element-derived protein 4 [Araneus ventricosus]|uniref:Tigger transposable element-derived protein 4 n=1 Tax=Araneus ventricosus TaxID=182803 RepID=A0A4Y2BL26_ARAVE|nr:Tigger transposable element-derived protein 4 [Araneus ventricosus]